MHVYVSQGGGRPLKNVDNQKQANERDRREDDRKGPRPARPVPRLY